jgi:uncharacterized protein (TIGR00730 family)
MKSIAVYCGANTGNDPNIVAAAQQLGKILAERNIRLIYGSGRMGLMGVVADAVLEHGGKVTGVVPTFLKNMEVCHTDKLTEFIEVETMHQRKQIMADRADAFLALPGGYGTLDEMFEILAWSQLMLHNKPVGWLNIDGFYDFIAQHLDLLVEKGFMREHNRGLSVMAPTIPELLEKMADFDVKSNLAWV